ncbi:PilN domain-containing protein [Cellulomonas edaphi]|uniref:Fimbrial assembly protein n=1 Tax=Cellulomonas edaphi TaxID=3053468 RepID=A0ABT7S6H4_9CELL|nr:fimbrial assembly protein [Cellulomons edaphi]MDM7831222.1 fimbrial assembly protein [Cellulomons edaphi]
MNLTLTKSSTKAPKGTALSGTLPQVNLLPPEVRAARGLKALKRLLGLGLVAVLILLAGGYVGATLVSSSADDELTEAQTETARLQSEQAKYKEVPQVLAALSSTSKAIEMGMSTDVEWGKYIDAISAILPKGVSIDVLGMSGATPMIAPLPPGDPLQAPSVSQLTFTLRANFIPDSAQMMDKLNKIPGFSDSWVSAAVATEDEHGIYYTVTSTVQVTLAAYSHRFDVTEGVK